MIGQTYPFLRIDYISESDVLWYAFLSYGEEVIPKAIAYTPIDKEGETYYNWGFGDMILTADGKYRIDDQVESNNGDIKIVFYTVVSTLSDFFSISSRRNSLHRRKQSAENGCVC